MPTIGIESTLGLNTSSFKQKADGVVTDVKGIKKSFSDIKDVMMAGGVVAAVTGFFSTAIEGARASKDINDENAAAVRRFGDSLDGAKKTGQEFATKTVGMFNQIGEITGTAAKAAWAFWTGSSEEFSKSESALNATEKAARKAEAALAEAKKHEKDFTEISAQLKDIEEKKKETILKSLTDQERVNFLANQLTEIRAKQELASGKALESRKLELEAAKARQQYDEASLALYQKTISEQRKANEEMRAAKLEQITVEERQVIIAREIKDIQSLLNAKVLNASDTEYYTAQLKSRQLELTKAEVAEKKTLQELAVKDAENYSKELDRKREDMSLQQKLKEIIKEQAMLKDLIAGSDASSKEHAFYITRQEQLRNDALKTQKDLKSNDVEIAKLLLKGAENLSDVEKEKLKLLKGETTEAKELAEVQILTQKLVGGYITPAEKARLAVLVGQTAEIRNQNDQLNQQLSIIYKIKGQAYDAQSTRSLEAVVKNLQDQLFEAQYQSTIRTHEFAEGTVDSSMVSITKAELFKAQQELDLRNRVQALVNQYGSEDAAFQHWTGTVADFDRGVQYSTATSSDSRNAQQQTSLLEQINNRLKNGAGLSTN
ncbi:MAG: hypothetical protein WC378_00915 [Opitutaceae bacterium]|jgi:hypothetical protein